MDARDHGATGVQRRSAWRVVGAWSAAALLLAALAAGCGTQPTPTATPPPTSSAPATPILSATPAPTPSPTPAYADTLRFGFVPGNWEAGLGWFLGFRQTSGSVWAGILRPPNLVHAAIYRWDARYDVFPDLADGECFVPGDDGKVIRCRLVKAAFHDGAPVTADDVAYSFLVSSRPTWYPWPNEGIWRLAEARVVDPRTVDFVLTAVDPTFLTLGLPTVPILPRHAVEASYAEFVANTKDLAAKDLATLADTIDEETQRDPPVCTPRVEEVATLLDRIGITLHREDFTGATGAFDACAYMPVASGFIRQAASALQVAADPEASELDAVAAAMPLLGIEWRPVGAGPYRFVSEDAAGVHLEAWPGYHGTPAATRFVDFVPTDPDGSGLEDGTIDVFQDAFLGRAYQATAESRGVRVLNPQDETFMALHFNVRPGRLFAERDLRLALQLCVDLPRDVDAAMTTGPAIPAYGPVVPGSWPEEPDIPKPPRDVDAARQLIEGAGWALGADGIYAKDGVRLKAEIVTRDEEPRVKMADLIAVQARECGMHLRGRPTSHKDILAELLAYPHHIPRTSEPYDLFLGALAVTLDPGGFGYAISSEIPDAEHPQRLNHMGFSDPALDRLVEAAMATYDQDERARLYREAQLELAAQLPILFLWWFQGYDVVRSTVATVDGPLDAEAPSWTWQPERLVVVSNP